MTDIGWVGLGKLGLPCALALAVRGGHKVTGYDISDTPWDIVYGQAPPMREEGLAQLLDHHPRTLHRAASPAAVVAFSRLVIVGVQTPHPPGYGGETPVPDDRRDFEYAYLVQAVRELCAAAKYQARHITVVVLSTVLPGTMNRLIRPLGNAYTTLLYSPAFISLGTTIADFCDPEFVICGADRETDTALLRQVYGTLHAKPFAVRDMQTAETVKVAYNAFLSTKIAFGNMLMELCHHTGADADAVVSALGLARAVGTAAYLRPGMGDGGPCRPRDLQALSWLGAQAGLSFDFAAMIGHAREAQTKWLAGLVASYAAQAGEPAVILGGAYKPGSDLTAGSPALLLQHYLTAAGTASQMLAMPHHWAGQPRLSVAVYVAATACPEFADLEFLPGSVVIDPWGYIPDRAGVTVVRVGRH